MNQITDFWAEQYLDRFISRGGSKIKFVTGGAGKGKSECLRVFLQDAEKRGFKTAMLSAKKTWVHDFKEIYSAVLEAIDLDSCLAKCAELIVKEMGFDPSEASDGMSFADLLTEKGQFDPITRRELRNQINATFYKNRRMDSNFAVCMSLLTGNILCRPALEPVSCELLSDWLRGLKGVRVTELRKLGMSSSKITKYNARHMLRSLAELIRIAGGKGLVVAVDDLDALVDSGLTAEVRYTKLRREDAYESIRELIDDIDSMNGVMFVFAFNKKLLENEKTGLKSYQALWMRIQSEIENKQFNRFADIIDMDKPTAVAATARDETSEAETSAMATVRDDAFENEAATARGETSEAETSASARDDAPETAEAETSASATARGETSKAETSATARDDAPETETDITWVTPYYEERPAPQWRQI